MPGHAMRAPIHAAPTAASSPVRIGRPMRGSPSRGAGSLLVPPLLGPSSRVARGVASSTSSSVVCRWVGCRGTRAGRGRGPPRRRVGAAVRRRERDGRPGRGREGRHDRGAAALDDLGVARDRARAPGRPPAVVPRAAARRRHRRGPPAAYSSRAAITSSACGRSRGSGESDARSSGTRRGSTPSRSTSPARTRVRTASMRARPKGGRPDAAYVIVAAQPHQSVASVIAAPSTSSGER